VIVHIVDVVGISDYHWLNFLFIIIVYSLLSRDR